MFGSATLEVAIGVIFIFLLVSILCSSIREGLEAWFKTRAAYLEYGIRELLRDKDGKGLAQSLYEHPLICTLFSGDYTARKLKEKTPLLASGKNLPSYIPAKNFASALLDIAARGPQTDEVSSHPASPMISLDAVRLNLMNIQNQSVRRALLTAIDTSEGSLQKAQKNIEEWYDSGMDRVSGWYKRSTNWVLFWIGLVVAVGLNINAISIIDYLSKHDAARAVIVAKAEQATKDSLFTSQSYSEAKKELDSLHLPIGWSQGWGAITHNEKKFSDDWWNKVWAPILGWLTIALAAMMGAPFWFDLLNKVMVIRSTVKPHEKSPEESSEDRQKQASPAPTVVINQGQPPGEVPAQSPPLTPSSAFIDVPTPRDESSVLDGCELGTITETDDENLPPSEGGVA